MNIKPNKLLGQNFLRCAWVTDTMIETADLQRSDTVLEIGPGTGVLTRDLAKHVKRVLAVEKDSSLALDLEARLKKDKINNVRIIKGDILRLFPIEDLASGSYKVVANIPYYLTSHLLRILLENNPRPSIVLLTIQKEVAERICARDKKMSLLALAVQAFGNPKIVKTVPADCFSPRPKIDSAIIKIDGISDNFFRHYKITPEAFFEVARRGFSQKRKLLFNNLAQKTNKPVLQKIFTELNISRTARAEELTKEQWARVTFNLSRFLK